MNNSIEDTLFVVDNQNASTSVMELLQNWSQEAQTLDVATGYFDLRVLFSALDGYWQSLGRIRILIGDEATTHTLDSLSALGDKVVEQIHSNIDKAKETDPLLKGLSDLLTAIDEGIIQIRVYHKGKFHAKAIIANDTRLNTATHSLVGSSNFTLPGIRTNVELNVNIRNPDNISELCDWFEAHWNEAKPIEDLTKREIELHTRKYMPFEIYAKALQVLFSSYDPPTASEWENKNSIMFHKLDRYQQEAYWALMRIAKIHKGAFLCDGVGLGKTFVGLMLIEHFVTFRRNNVALFVPKTTMESVWVPLLESMLPEIGGTSGVADLGNFRVFSHTDFSKRSKGFPQVFEHININADVVIIDEAHHFRNPGSSGRQGNRKPSRYQKIYKLLEGTRRPKSLFLLTATPICNSLHDFRHMIELFTRKDQHYFNKTLHIPNLKRYLDTLERRFTNRYQSRTETNRIRDPQEVLSSDKLISKIVVQRSREYAKKSQIRQHGKATTEFPEREDPMVVEYSIKVTYGKLLSKFKRAFDKRNPLFDLPLYSPLRWAINPHDIDQRQYNSQTQVIGLIRTLFLKRFESSIQSFEISCITLLSKTVAFIKANERNIETKVSVADWLNEHKDLIAYASSRHKQYGMDELYSDDDMLVDEMEKNATTLDPNKYKLKQIINAAWNDVNKLSEFLYLTMGWDYSQDDKGNKLIELLKGEELRNNKVLIFTEFAHTARYLRDLLISNGIEGVGQFDGSSKVDRKAIVRRFAPYYNGTSTAGLSDNGEKEIRVLIATDVLSEGLNLQDATKLINYDIHWSPVRLMQRIGRVDRRMDRSIEDKMKIECEPEITASRGIVKFWNFLPPNELNDILSLYKKVSEKTLLISKTFGIEGRKLFTEKDEYRALRDFNEAYEQFAYTKMEEIHIAFQQILENDRGLEESLNRFPKSIYSGKSIASGGNPGVFFCYSLPIYDETAEKFLSGGDVNWYFYDRTTRKIIDDPLKIFDMIKCEPDTPRMCEISETELISIRKKVEEHLEHIRPQAPIIPTPELICWMELA